MSIFDRFSSEQFDGRNNLNPNSKAGREEAHRDRYPKDYEDVPLEPERSPRKAMHVDLPDDDFYVHPSAKLATARRLWRDVNRVESPLYNASKPQLRPTDPVQTFKLSEDTTAYIYDAPGLKDGVVWGEVRGKAIDTFLGVSDDANDLIQRARDLDLSHITPK